MVVGLDTTDATFSCHDALQQLKTHPFIQRPPRGRRAGRLGREDDPLGRLLDDAAGASRCPAWSWPATTSRWCNVPYLKGIHYAMHAGMLRGRGDRRVAEEGLRSTSRTTTARSSKSEIEKDLYKSRNVRQYGDKGFVAFGGIANAWLLSGGALPPGHKKVEPDSEVPMEIGEGRREVPDARRRVHLRQALLGLPLGQRDPRRRAEPRADPGEGAARGRADLGLDVPGAGLRDPRGPARERRSETVDVNVTASNCVQCGAITAKGGRLTLPEGGDGPLYQET